jgi:hypothetical protein
MLFWKADLVLTTRFIAAELFREIVLQAKDLESETAESRSRNNAPLSLRWQKFNTPGLDVYEFPSRLVCTFASVSGVEVRIA